MRAWLDQGVHLVTVAAPSPSPSPGQDNGTTAVQIWTLIVAVLAVLATLVTAFFARRTGKGQVAAANKAAVASERSAEAADKSAQAAQEAVGVNRETAAGVAERAHADSLSQRYQDAAAQLGHDKAAVRLAGVYAMARLADDWPEQRQECVDVLCAYMRIPSPARSGVDRQPDELRVRQSLMRLVARHLRPADHPVSWSNLSFDFSLTALQDMDLSDAVFEMPPSFRGSHFLGHNFFVRVTFRHGGNFRSMVVRNSAELVFDEVLVEEKELDLTQLTVGQSAHFVMGPKDLQEQAKITMAFTDNHGSIDLYFHEQESKPGFFEARSMKVAAGADLNVRETDPDLDIDSEHWPTVNLRYAEVEGNGTVLIPRRLVDGGVVSWDPKPDVPPEADVRIWS